MQEILTNAKNLLGCVFLACVIYLAIQVTVLVQDARAQLNRIAPKIETTAQNLSNASNALAKSSASVEKASSVQVALFTDKKTQQGIGALLRSSEDLTKLIDNINDIAREVKKETVPRTNEAISATTKALQSTDKLLLTADKNLDKLADIAGQDLEVLRQLLADENLKRLLGNLADTSASVKQTAEHVEATSDEIKKAIPELIAELKSISKHTDDSTGEIATFLATLNKPQTKKQKLFRYLIQAATIAAPIAIRR